MRQHTYRGKRKDDGEWVYGDLIHNCLLGGYVPVAIKHNQCAPVEVIPETVGQFICKNNGIEIWEGDIVKFKGYVGEFYEDGKHEWLTGEVFHKTNGSVGYSIKVGGRDNYILSSNRKYKVIGNKVDNPELLEDVK